MRRAVLDDDDDDDDGRAAAKFSESDQWDRAVLWVRATVDGVGRGALAPSDGGLRRPVGGTPRRSVARSR